MDSSHQFSFCALLNLERLFQTSSFSTASNPGHFSSKAPPDQSSAVFIWLCSSIKHGKQSCKNMETPFSTTPRTVTVQSVLDFHLKILKLNQYFLCFFSFPFENLFCHAKSQNGWEKLFKNQKIYCNF